MFENKGELNKFIALRTLVKNNKLNQLKWQIKLHSSWPIEKEIKWISKMRLEWDLNDVRTVKQNKNWNISS